jgi:hypothetical protein
MPKSEVSFSTAMEPWERYLLPSMPLSRTRYPIRSPQSLLYHLVLVFFCTCWSALQPNPGTVTTTSLQRARPLPEYLTIDTMDSNLGISTKKFQVFAGNVLVHGDLVDITSQHIHMMFECSQFKVHPEMHWLGRRLRAHESKLFTSNRSQFQSDEYCHTKSFPTNPNRSMTVFSDMGRFHYLDLLVDLSAAERKRDGYDQMHQSTVIREMGSGLRHRGFRGEDWGLWAQEIFGL